jgi:SAM-dependent methyltransferase
MNYPDYNTYTKLYGRYLKKGPERFFAKCDPNGKSVLDLCSGGGQLSTYALEHGASNVLMVDLARQMCNPDFKGLGRTCRIETEVEGFLACNKIQYDIVVCRQAVNYWFLNVNGKDIARAVTKSGMFVFNTFGNKPSETPTVREYYHEGVAYKELSYLIDGKIHHVQAATGIPPHFTVFDWIDWREYRQKLSPYFILDEVVEGPSSMWYCTRI